MNEEAFTAEFPNLFDVCHGNAFQMITIQEDKDFLLAQQEPGRRGCMAGLNRKLKKKEDEKTTRMEQIKKRKIASRVATKTSKSNSRTFLSHFPGLFQDCLRFFFYRSLNSILTITLSCTYFFVLVIGKKL